MTRYPDQDAPEARLGRRAFLQLAVPLSVAVTLPRTGAASATRGRTSSGSRSAATPSPGFELDELTVSQLRTTLESGERTARSIAELYLRRADEIDQSGPGLHAIIERNPDALTIAQALDAERRAHGPRGPLHGIPVLIKDNIDTADRMRTSAGSLALADRSREKMPRW